MVRDLKAGFVTIPSAVIELIQTMCCMYIINCYHGILCGMTLIILTTLCVMSLCMCAFIRIFFPPAMCVHVFACLCDNNNNNNNNNNLASIFTFVVHGYFVDTFKSFVGLYERVRACVGVYFLEEIGWRMLSLFCYLFLVYLSCSL